MFGFRLRLAVFFGTWFYAGLSLGHPHAQHVFVVSMDGASPAVIVQSKMPVLKQLVAEGAHTWTAKTIFPSKTLPSHVSMLTGFSPAKHAVLWNDWIPTNGLVRVPTIFSEAERAHLSTAMFVGKEKVRHLLVPGTVEQFDFNRRSSIKIIKTEAGETKTNIESTVKARVVAEDAAAYILKFKPNLCFVHFTDGDDIGHEHGWASKEQKQALSEVDTALGVVCQAIRDAGIAEESVLLITADHGGHEQTHGLNTNDDMTIPWVAWGKGVKKGFQIIAPVVTYDTAATALWLLDLPLAERLDGYPVATAFN